MLMIENNPVELGLDELHFTSRTQLDTATEVLHSAGVNPEAVIIFEAVRKLHEGTGEPGALDELDFFLKGEQVVRIKSDLTEAAKRAEVQSPTTEAKAAARDLLEALGITR